MTESSEVVHHGKHRNRRAAISGGMAMLARCVQVGSSLLTVPLTLKYLGAERFGLWMTISSVLAMAAFADFGVGNGVLNTVAKAFGQDDVFSMRRAISSGFGVLCLIAITFLVGFFGIYPFVNWAHVFRVVSPLAMAEAGPALIVFVLSFALNIAFDTVQRVQMGIQEGYRYGRWQMVGSLTGLAGVLAGIWFHVGLPVLVMAIAGAPLLATMTNAVHFFGFVRPDLRPSIHFISKPVVIQVVRLGLLFFILQLASSIAFSADNFIIARTLGAVRVPEYAIPQRMFALISMMTAMLVTPLWPAYGEAVSRGDFAWVRQTLRRSLLGIFAASTVAATTIFLLSHRILALWVGGRVKPSFALLLGLAIWAVMECCGSTLAMYFNGASVIRYQIILASVFGIGCLATKIIMIKRFGIAALPWSTITTYFLLDALPASLIVGRSLRGLERAHASLTKPPAIPSVAITAER
jgi:O-antigen/teichoic acid export membrane protein